MVLDPSPPPLSHARNHGNCSSVYASGKKKESALHPWIHTYIHTYTQHTVLGPTSSWKFCIKVDLNCCWLEMFQKHTAAVHVVHNLKSGFQMLHCVQHVTWCDAYLCIHLDIRFVFLSVLISIPWERKASWSIYSGLSLGLNFRNSIASSRFDVRVLVLRTSCNVLFTHLQRGHSCSARHKLPGLSNKSDLFDSGCRAQWQTRTQILESLRTFGSLSRLQNSFLFSRE